MLLEIRNSKKKPAPYQLIYKGEVDQEFDVYHLNETIKIIDVAITDFYKKGIVRFYIFDYSYEVILAKVFDHFISILTYDNDIVDYSMNKWSYDSILSKF